MAYGYASTVSSSNKIISHAIIFRRNRKDIKKCSVFLANELKETFKGTQASLLYIVAKAQSQRTLRCVCHCTKGHTTMNNNRHHHDRDHHHYKKDNDNVERLSYTM